MKKIMTFLFARVLMSALCVGVVACNRDTIYPDPNADCWVFVSTIPGEETILLAKSGLTFEEGKAIEADFESKYGKESIWMRKSYPGDIYKSVNLPVDFNADPYTVPNCYEITMTIKFPESSVPSVKDLSEYLGFGVVRIIDRTVICKLYEWPFTDDGAEKYIQYHEDSYDYYSNRFNGWPGSGGMIVGKTTFKNLGTELHNEPVIF